MTDRAFGPAIVALGGTQLMMTLDGTVAALALPRLQLELGLSEPGKAWVLSAYALAFGGLMLLGGRLGDTFGRKRVFLAGVGVFTLASLACGLALGEISLVIARAVQGAGAAIAAPTALALVATTFAPGPARNQAVAIFAAMTGIGSVAGLIVGGVLTELSWRWIFLINVPIGVAIAALAVFSLRETLPERRPLDVPGAIVGTVAVTAVTFAITEGATRGWTAPTVVTAGAAGAVLFLVFLTIERRASFPLLPFSLFGNPSRVAVFVAILLAGAVMFILAPYVAFFVQNVLGFSPIQSGLAFLPFAAAFGIAAFVSSQLVVRVPARFVIFAGTLITIAGLLYGSRLGVDSTYVPHLLIPIVVIGFGVGFVVVPLPLCAIAGVRESDIGPLTAVATVFQTLGGPLGLAAAGVLATWRTRSLGGAPGEPADMTPAQLEALSGGYTIALAGCAVVALAAGIAALFIRFTPEQIAVAQDAQAQGADAGVAADVQSVGAAHGFGAGGPATNASAAIVETGVVGSVDDPPSGGQHDQLGR